MSFPHSIRAAGCAAAAVWMTAWSAPLVVEAQTPPSAPATSSFTVFLRSTPIGSEQVTVERTGDGWTISASGRVGPPLDLVIRSFNARYDADWKPLELTVDSTLRGQTTLLHTVVSGTAASSDVTPLGAAPTEQSDEIAPDAVLLPNPFIAAYEALAARLRTAAAGTTIPIYQPPQGSFAAEVGESSTEQIQTLGGLLTARRTRLTFQTSSAPPLAVEIWGDDTGRLLRLSVPAQNLEVAREDVASVSARRVTMARPNDEDIRIPASAFSLAGTVSKPANAAGALPAVLLIGGSGPTDRDETVFGIPIFGELSNALADAGFLVLRYDKRGVGQSGGRPEAAGLADFAEDARAAIRTLAGRKDVDRKRIAVVGQSEGGSVAMLAAAKNNRVAALGLLATIGVTGRELNLYQVTHGLERSNRSAEEKQATIALQTSIQDAVLTGKGWEKIDIPEPVRRQADTPWFQSFLAFDPAKVMKDLKQPLLVVHGELDTQVPVSNADRLRTLGEARKDAAAVDVVKIPGVNHLLVPATTGELDEYGKLPDRHVSPAVIQAIVGWLQKTMPPSR
ncbi:MAG: alpha/beta fold hydrolase [Luteitalea sp.]|nr:alpha/beta fold hydrolase [Luteitalea sp.]